MKSIFKTVLVAITFVSLIIISGCSDVDTSEKNVEREEGRFEIISTFKMYDHSHKKSVHKIRDKKNPENCYLHNTGRRQSALTPVSCDF